MNLSGGGWPVSAPGMTRAHSKALEAPGTPKKEVLGATLTRDRRRLGQARKHEFGKAAAQQTATRRTAQRCRDGLKISD